VNLHGNPEYYFSIIYQLYYKPMFTALDLLKTEQRYFSVFKLMILNKLYREGLQ